MPEIKALVTEFILKGGSLNCAETQRGKHTLYVTHTASTSINFSLFETLQLILV